MRLKQKYIFIQQLIARDEKEKVSKRADYYEEAKAGDQDKYLRYNFGGGELSSEPRQTKEIEI